MSSYMERRELEKALKKHLPEEAAEEIFRAIENFVDAACLDLKRDIERLEGL